MTVYQNFINGEWIDSASEKTIQNANPANPGDIIGTTGLATPEQARRAVEAAYDAFDAVTPDMRIAREEIFGPVLSVLGVKDFDEAMRTANDCDYGLSSSIFTSDASRIFRSAESKRPASANANKARPRSIFTRN